jgi:hypothetical protein
MLSCEQRGRGKSYSLSLQGSSFRTTGLQQWQISDGWLQNMAVVELQNYLTKMQMLEWEINLPNQ